MFVFAVAAISIADCAGHGASLLPHASSSTSTKQPVATLYSLADQDKYWAPQPLPLTPILGEVRRFDGKEAPSGWAFCDGSVLDIRSYPSLFKLLGKLYGGDGKVTFALPTSQRFKMVIAIVGATPANPRELQAIFAQRPNRSATIFGMRPSATR